MTKRNENVIAILLEPLQLDREFIQWPLHITIVPWFHGYDEEKLDLLLAGLAKAVKPFSAVVGDVEKFGPKKDVAVNVIDDNSDLIKLHEIVFNELERNGFVIHQKDFVGDKYRAHVTRQPISNANFGDELEIKSLTLIKQERLKKSGVVVKKAVKEYEFTKK